MLTMLEGFLNSSFENVTSATFLAPCPFGRQVISSCTGYAPIQETVVCIEVIRCASSHIEHFFNTSVLCEVHEITKCAHALQFEWLRSSVVMHLSAMLLNRLFENSALMQRKRPSISQAGQEDEGCAPARRRLKLAQNMSL
jgi:hypothetical protein